MSGENGNGNGKGPPPFRLAPIVSPEEEARTELLRDIAPKLRRKIREDSRLSAGAKFFFYALFDDSFWHQVGGHGTGQVYADIRSLSERYGHDEKTISRWRDELVEAGWLWSNYEWPMTEWRLTPVLPAPANYPHKKAVQMQLGRAAKPEGDSPVSRANAENSGQSKRIPSARGQDAHNAHQSRPTSVGGTPLSRGLTGGNCVGEMPTGDGQNAHDIPPKRPQAKGRTPTDNGHSAHGDEASDPRRHQKQARLSASNDARENTPGDQEDRRSRGGMAPPPNEGIQKGLAKWERDVVADMFNSKREKLLTKLQQERSTMPKGPARDLLTEKITIVRRYINGPTLPADPKPSQPAKDTRKRESEETIAANLEKLKAAAGLK